MDPVQVGADRHIFLLLLMKVIVRAVKQKTLTSISLDNNEAAFSIAIVPFTVRGGELHLVVGTASTTFVAPRSCTSGFLRTYRFTNDGAGLELMHKVSSNMATLDAQLKFVD